MFNLKFTITNSINNSLLEIERARGFLDAAGLKEEWIEDMQSEATILEAHHSTHIEGSQPTLSQAQRILAGWAVGDVRDDDRQQKILLYLLDEKQASVEKIRQKFNLVRRTVQRDLSRLVDSGMIKEVAKSKTDPTKYYELL